MVRRKVAFIFDWLRGPTPEKEQHEQNSISLLQGKLTAGYGLPPPLALHGAVFHKVGAGARASAIGATFLARIKG